MTDLGKTGGHWVENAVHLQGALGGNVSRYVIISWCLNRMRLNKGRGKIMTQKGNRLRGLVAVLMMVGIVACAVMASPPQDLVAKNDHAGLETWYVQETAHLRQRAKDMLVMAEEYQKNPEAGSYGVMSRKIDMVQHCQTLAAIYTKAADEAEVIARAHRDLKPHS
ncbi:MAG: hypothetical protein NDI90_02665 [Nitrospira sp. BO4]|jgi:hypothetical protein|nr:hypothetical protein [Nitrospira sp. BO4]